PPANLVFLIDVSGSMQSSNKLELLKSSLGLLTRQLKREDRVSIVVYAGASGIVLEPTPGDEKGKIIAAIDRLTAGGSTNGASGIRLAYSL
ncbi:MAG: VWA domain-containing protein, partial [Gammaproteobacteria bacterium]|nr:VWA domain-containing protein [Gammaproteobacteria bacterium]NIO61560.1 VWA domain-containing protein [Gammaproteobacteria bacterium]